LLNAFGNMSVAAMGGLTVFQDSEKSIMPERHETIKYFARKSISPPQLLRK
jgi:hypothetical protein